MDKQTVYKHIKSHKSGRPDQSDITWKTLNKNVKYEDERECFQAFEIHNRSDNIIMNGYIGRTINPRADGAKRRARVQIPPGYLHPGKRKH
jgi:hypothetical protein